MATSISIAGQAGSRTTRPRLGLALAIIATAQLMIVLDSTIVNVALPRIQVALGFSGSGVEWVVNAYALTLGGLLLVGGRAGDLLGRRRMFVAGLLLFSAASLAGGFATSPGWLLAARAVQGAGGAVVAPTALALIATTFPEGPARGRAMSLYASMSVVGGAAGLLAGGLLVTYASWRWVLFVNVPVGLAVALGALVVLPPAARRPGRLDLPGAVTGTAGVAALVYGLATAAPGADGTAHWGDPGVLAALAAGVALLAAFAVIEARTPHALLPARVLRSRERVGAYLIMLGVGTAIFGVFFFLTVFVQEVWGYSALRAGVAFLPFTVAMLAGSVAAAKLLPRAGARLPLLAGCVASAAGLFWLSRAGAHGSYPVDLLGPCLVTGTGLGLLFVPLPQVALAGVAEADSGIAASLLNAGRQVGGSLGLAVLGTIAWTVVANRTRAAGALPGSAAYARALTAGFDRGFLIAAALVVVILGVTVTMIRSPRATGQPEKRDI